MKQKTTYNKICEFCGKEFSALRITSRFCNVKCNSKAINEQRRLETVKKHNKKADRTRIRKPRKAPNPEYFSISATADVLNISRPTVYKMIETGQLKAIRITDRVVRIKKSDIEQINSIIITKN